MKASVGDRIVTASGVVGARVREGVVVSVRNADGSPTYQGSYGSLAPTVSLPSVSVASAPGSHDAAGDAVVASVSGVSAPEQAARPSTDTSVRARTGRDVRTAEPFSDGS